MLWNNYKCVYPEQCSCKRTDDGIDYPIGSVIYAVCEEWYVGKTIHGMKIA